MPKRFAFGTSLGLFPRRASQWWRSRGEKTAKRASGRRAILQACMDVLEDRVLLSTTWYVATSGSNANAGTLAKPFLTIQQAANVAQSGDTVEIEGGTYRETVTPAHSGVTFTDYDNQTVIVSGTDKVSSFSDYSGSIYQASSPANLGEGNNQVFVDGVMMNEARWPNTSLAVSTPTQGTIGSVSGSTIYDSALTQSAGYWTGALIRVTPGDGWVSYVGTVTNSGVGWITVSLPSAGQYEQPIAGNNFYLFGKLSALDTSGEWYMNSSGQLYLWDPNGDNPANHDVEVKARDLGFALGNVSNTTIEGINLFACTIQTSSASTGTTINYITAQYITQFDNQGGSGWAPPGVDGIELEGANSILENSTIAYSAGDGVFVSAANVTVSNNTIHDVDYSGTDAAAIRVYGANATITKNTIYNTGRDGINDQAAGDKITYNTIYDFMLQTYDGGGIYTVSDTGGGTIAYNVVYNAHDNNTAGLIAAGIFLDNNSANWTVDNNVTANVDVGFKANGTSYNEQVYDNKLGATQQAIQTNGWTGFAYSWSGSDLYNNIYYNSVVELGANVTQSNNTFASGSPALPASSTTVYTSLPTTTTTAASPPPPPPPSVVSVSPPPPPAATTTAIATSFTTAAPAASQLNVHDATITSSAGVELGLRFSSTVAGYITGVRFYKSSLNTGTHTGELWSSSGALLATATFANESASGWQQVNFSSAVGISANTTYVVSYHTTAAYITYMQGALASGESDDQLKAAAGAGVYQYGAKAFPNSTNGQSPSYGVDVVFSSTPVTSTTTTTTTTSAVASIFASATPAAASQNVSDPTISSDGGVTVGLKFTSSVAGKIVGVKFWKGSLNTGTHTAQLWSSSGTLLASATFTSESASGWQTVDFATPVSISANTTYIVSYHTTSPHIAYTAGYFSSGNKSSGSLTATGSVYSYGSSASFPTQNNGQAPFYWVDALFQAS